MVGLPSLFSMLGSLDRERLQANLQSGKIQQPEFEDAVGELALRQMTKIMQLHVPDLPTPDPTDAVDYLDNIFRFHKAVSAEGSEYNNILQRAEGARGLVDNIYNDWEKLQVIIDAYSGHLHKRWTKRITLRRKLVLEEAWGPGMSPMHRPDFDVIRRGLKGPKHRDALIMPYINLEDLSSKTNMLSLIESRTRMPPEHFAWFDSVSYKTATNLGAVKPAAAYRKVMLLTGQKTRETYGRLSEIDEDNVEDIVGTGFAFQLGHGLVILETQQRLYRFLRRCVELLLHDIDLSQLAIIRAAVDEQQTVSLQDTKLSPTSKEWQSVSEVNIQASYQLPRLFSLASLRKLAGAKRDAAEDAFWTLHEDPGYFRQQLEMRIEQSMETSRRAFNPRTVEAYALTNGCIHTVLYACREIIIWEAIAVELIVLDDTRAGLDVEIQLSKRLPRSYETAAGRFLALMYSAWRYAVSDMYCVLTSSDTFIDFFEIERAEDGAYVDFYPKQSTKDQWPPIMKLLTELTSTNSNMMGAMNILDEMERIFNSDETQRALINSEVAREISRLAALAEIHDAFVRHQPTIQSTGDSRSKLIAQLARLKPIDELESYLARIHLNTSITPISAFNYPVEKKRTSYQVEQMRLAERKLDAFWANLDRELISQVNKTLLQWMGNRLEAREIHRTPPWQPEENRTTKPSAPGTPYQPFPSPGLGRTEKLPTEPKQKQKTRGDTDPYHDFSTIEPTEPAAPTAPSTANAPTRNFTLPPRLLKIMTAFYPTSTQDRTSRKIIWKDFLHAMYSLGFEIQKRHGSEWYFEPSWQRNSPITIHEPHPSHEMRSEKIRFEANRMARKYGWSSGNFVAA